MATDLATCRARDVKGLYARQARGELRGLTGVDDPYEPPLAPELVLDTASSLPRRRPTVCWPCSKADRPRRRPLWGADRDRGAERLVALPAPHGGRLTERLVAADQAEALAAQAARLPAVPWTAAALADLECLAVGAFSPLTGFLGAADHTSVVERGRLAGGPYGRSRWCSRSRPRRWPRARNGWP